MQVRSFARRKMRNCLPAYVANFFFSIHYAAILFVNSSYLERFFPFQGVVLFFILGALGNIFLFLFIHALLKLLGNRKLFFILLLLELLATLGLAFSTTPLAAGVLFIVYSSLPMLVFYSLDLFLEDLTPEALTGEIRAIDLTIGNIAIAGAPLLIPLLAPDGQFKFLYFASALMLLPVIFISRFSFRRFKDGRERIPSLILPFYGWWQNLNLRRAASARFVLEFFYAVMVIFMPIYLSQIIRFSWAEIGFIFTIMLLPFILFEIPAGELADHWCGEKEIMTVGFLIMGLAVLSIAFLGHRVFLWAAVLFISRIGASLVEITSESYFFKHVDKRDAGFISIFRMTRPVAIIAGALVGGAVILGYSFFALFFILALVVLAGMKESLNLLDTL